MTVDNTIIHEHVETDLSDATIDRLIADAIAAIEDRDDTAAEQTVVIAGGERYIFLPHPISDAGDISEIIERWGALETTLDTTDWRWLGGRRLERIVGVGNLAPTWWGWAGGFTRTDVEVVVTYTPKDDSARRDRVTIDLVRLAIQHNALSSERAGDYASSSVEYQRERDRILRELVTPMGVA